MNLIATASGTGATAGARFAMLIRATDPERFGLNDAEYEA